tara:strand:- start:4769 stop:6304 length:1536 start_codon:yes stop_codon:yes gene_type:complete
VSNRKKRAISGILAGTSGSVLLQVTTLIVTPFYLNLTSQEIFGLWLTLFAILGWIKIGDLGLGMALTRRAVEALELEDYKLLSRLTYGAILPALSVGFVVVSLGFLATEYLVTLFNITSELENSFVKTFHTLLFVALLKSALGTFGSLIDAKQHIAFLHVRNTVVSLLTTMLTLVFLFLDYGILSFGYGLLFEALIMPFVDITYLRIIDKKIIFFPIKTSKKEIISLFKFGGPFQILKITNLVNTNVDNIFIAAIIGAASVPVYVFSGKLAFLFSVFLIGIIPSMLFPGISQLFEQKDLNKISNVYFKLSNMALRMGILFGVIYFILNKSFVSAWVGIENYAGYSLTLIFIIWIILESFIRGITIIVYSSGKIYGLALVTIFEAGVKIILTLLLIPSIGLVGAVLATLLSRIMSLFFIPITINKTLKIQTFEFIKNLFHESIVYSIPTITFAFLMHNYIGAEIDSLKQAFIFAFLAFIINIVSFEGLFLIRQKGLKWRDRVSLLLRNLFSV